VKHSVVAPQHSIDGNNGAKPRKMEDGEYGESKMRSFFRNEKVRPLMTAHIQCNIHG
jgi:hypothetical protein